MLAGPDVRFGTALPRSPDGATPPQRVVADIPRSPALTGMRAVAALLVVGTHAAFATGTLTHGYVGAVYARLEIGVALFFVLSGFLLFRPWVVAAATDGSTPGLVRYARHRLRRIAPGYLMVAMATFELYVVFTPGPNPAQTWHGLLRYLTLTQIYTDDYLTTYLHPGLSQMWSLAVEVSFYAALPAIAYVVLQRRRGRWRPARVLTALAVLGVLTPAWLVIAAVTDALPNAAGMWLPAHLACFAGGMALAVLGAVGAQWRAYVALPLAGALFLIVATPLGGPIVGPAPFWAPATKAVLYAAIATLTVGALVLGASDRYARILSSSPMVWLGAISYEIFLLHVVVMAVTMNLVLRWPLFTGSLLGLYMTTLAVTIPFAWALHRVTGPRQTRTSKQLA
ncbi:acyltransferase family protein [Mycolicibacterium stellerae]|uniref:acyltransferase family protein n=1 Tax=Mycolicibacterium stellerae TaxID=2358193 RepID=UPI001F42325A|nr:acyltransferase [Mycolicibacterium stellerae]